jgi:hypothetical protein
MYVFQMVWLIAGIVTLSAGLTMLEAFWRAARGRWLRSTG